MQNGMGRRGFVGSVLAAAGCAGWPRTRCPRMGVQLASVRELVKVQGLIRTLAELAALGFEGVELVGQPGYYGKGVPAYQGLSAAQVKTALDGAGLAACGAHEAMRDMLPDRIAATLDFVRAYGGSFVACTMGTPRNAGPEEAGDWWRRMADAFAVSAEIAASRGCKIGLHNHGTEFTPIGGGPSGWEIFFARTSPLVQMEIDTGWAVAEGADPVFWLKKYPGRSYAVHAKEMFAPGSPGILGQPGHGADGTPLKGVDWPEFLTAMDDDGGVAWCIVESEADRTSTRTVREGLAYLRLLGRFVR
ncbi:MAG: sugar phosphate isomerase/epimerase [Kiritimatiellae bacterium]|nr:sugar phosphate isomerase/epimerase [Kiritimatiellia bacterium]